MLYEQRQVVGNQEPRILHVPEMRYSLGDESVELAESCGLVLDPWQRDAMRYSLGFRHNGLFAARDCGLVVSRQNGKGAILEARMLAALFLLDEPLTIYTSHVFSTSQEMFQRLVSLVEANEELKAQVKPRGGIINTHGDEGITLKNGNRVKFKARNKGSGRGFSCDCLILDEAMYLPMSTIAAIQPTMSARPNPQMWMAGSAGFLDSVAFGSMRNRALREIAGRDSGGSGSPDPLYFAEWSIDACNDFCPEDCRDHDDFYTIESYQKSNPGLGYRLSIEAIELERKAMDKETFGRERLGVGTWPLEEEAWRIISEEHWTNAIDQASAPQSPLVFAVDVAPDRSFACITVAGDNGEDKIHVEITGDGATDIDYKRGTRWVIPRLKELHARWRPAAIVLDRATQAGEFYDALENEGFSVLTPTAREYAQACGKFYSGVVPPRGGEATIVHMDQAPLNSAISGADKRDLAAMWAWDRRSAATDITPLVSATLAAWAAEKMKLEKPTEAPWVMAMDY